MSKKFYLVGKYNNHQVYYNKDYNIILEKGTDELEELEGLEKDIMIQKMGGSKGLSIIIQKYTKRDKKTKPDWIT